MMQLTTLAALLFCSATFAKPITKRAGGPAITPIPSNCTILNPLPHSTCTVGQSSGYKLCSNFTSANLLYQAYYDSSLSLDATWTECIEQCYGYGSRGTCKSALLAYAVPVPAGWFGLKNGTLSPTACLLYGAYATPDDFEATPAGQYVNETAGDIYCGF